MTQEEKELLLKDLCARLPYGIKFKADNEECIREIHYIKDEDVYIREYRNLPYWIDTIKPYLRPMSSMTEEERKELFHIIMHIEAHEIIEQLKNDDCGIMEGKYHFNSLLELDWLNAHHFDYRGLIPMGLALEAQEEMYNIILGNYDDVR